MPKYTYKEYVDAMSPEGLISHFNRQYMEGKCSVKYHEQGSEVLIHFATWPILNERPYITAIGHSLWRLDTIGFELVPGKYNLLMSGDSLMTFLRAIDFQSMPRIPTQKLLAAGTDFSEVEDCIITLIVMTASLYSLKMGKHVEIANNLLSLPYPMVKQEVRRRTFEDAKNTLEDNIRTTSGLHLSSVLAFMTGENITPNIPKKMAY